MIAQTLQLGVTTHAYQTTRSLNLRDLSSTLLEIKLTIPIPARTPQCELIKTVTGIEATELVVISHIGAGKKIINQRWCVVLHHQCWGVGRPCFCKELDDILEDWGIRKVVFVTMHTIDGMRDPHFLIGRPFGGRHQA